MKVRVLYPAALQDEEKPPAAGDVIDVPDQQAQAFIDAGYVEEAKAKAKVEKATAAPGEEKDVKRGPGRPRKSDS